jgi:hypothetical protein
MIKFCQQQKCLQMFGRVKCAQIDASVQSSQLHQGFKDGRESLEGKQRTDGLQGCETRIK